jgi:hypothetical protein
VPRLHSSGPGVSYCQIRAVCVRPAWARDDPQVALEERGAELPVGGLPAAGQGAVAELQDEVEVPDAGLPGDALRVEEPDAAAALQDEAQEGVGPPADARVVAEPDAAAQLQDEAEARHAGLPAGARPAAAQAVAALPDGPPVAALDAPPALAEPAAWREEPEYLDGFLPNAARPLVAAPAEAPADSPVPADGPVAHLAAHSVAIARVLPAQDERRL